MLRKTDINEKLVQFAWWPLATISFIPVVAIGIRLLGLRSNTTKAIRLCRQGHIARPPVLQASGGEQSQISGDFEELHRVS